MTPRYCDALLMTHPPLAPFRHHSQPHCCPRLNFRILGSPLPQQLAQNEEPFIHYSCVFAFQTSQNTDSLIHHSHLPLQYPRF